MPPLRLDPDYQRATAPFAGIVPPTPKDAADLRRLNDAAIATLLRSTPSTPTPSQIHYTSTDGTPLILHRFPAPTTNPDTPANAQPQPAILYLHGGGLLSGSVPLFTPDIQTYSANTTTQIFAPAYRLAPEWPYPTPLEDIYSALLHMHAHAATLNIDTSRIAILGISAGGGLAVAAALMARDKGLTPEVGKLVLVYPMLDDRTGELGKGEEGVRGFLSWTERKNVLGWGAYLTGHHRGHGVGQEEGVKGENGGGNGSGNGSGGMERVEGCYAVPARVEDVSGLPRTYIEVGGLDLFRGECVEFAGRLARAGVEVEFHLYPGVPHAWDWMAKNAPVTKRAMENRVRALKDL